MTQWSRIGGRAQDPPDVPVDPLAALGRVVQYRSSDFAPWEDVLVTGPATGPVVEHEGFSDRTVLGPGIWLLAGTKAVLWASTVHGLWRERPRVQAHGAGAAGQPRRR